MENIEVNNCVVRNGKDFTGPLLFSVDGINFGLMARILGIYMYNIVLLMIDLIFENGQKPYDALKVLLHCILIKPY